MYVTKKEQLAVNALKKVAKKWPKSLWLFSANGTLCIMKKDIDGHVAILPTLGVDPDYVVDTIDIENDGGDW